MQRRTTVHVQIRIVLTPVVESLRDQGYAVYDPTTRLV